MKKLIGYKVILMAAMLWGGLSPAQAFVMIGPANTSTNANETAQLNYTDDMGTPKDINRGTKRFFLL